MLTILKKNYYFFIFLVFYIFVGIYLSINNGITSDEYHEQLNWKINLSAILNYFKDGTYDELLNYGDRYHGIAFHYISQPIQILTYKIISNYSNLSDIGGHDTSICFINESSDLFQYIYA